MVIGDSGNPAIFGVIGHGGSERMVVSPVMVVDARRRRPPAGAFGLIDPGATVAAWRLQPVR
ncbi:MAG TPA: hypothetical protein VF322_08635 [Gammaproteobacteria bacterium]|jgi:hypothetical protein